MDEDLTARPGGDDANDEASLPIPANYPGHLARDVRSINGEVLHPCDRSDRRTRTCSFNSTTHSRRTRSTGATSL